MADPKPLPIRQRILSFLTPSTADFLVAESVDITRTAIPAYGTAHPDTPRYPNHKFCFAMAADEQGLVDTFIYAMARANQDAYNFTYVRADIGGQKFDAVKRTYVTLRSAFTPATPATGTALANTPASMFASYGSYVLAERQQVRSGDKELDTIFVVDEQTYVKKVPFTQIDFDETFGGVLTTTQTLYYSTETISQSATTRATYTTSLTGTNNDVLWTAAVAGTAGNSVTIAYTTPTLATTVASAAGSAVSVAAGTHARMTVTGSLYADLASLDPVNFDKLYAVQGNATALWSSDGSASVPDSGDWYRIAGSAAFGSAGTYTLDKYYNGVLVASWTGTSVTYPSASSWSAVSPASGAPTVTSGISSADQVIAAVAANAPSAALLSGVPKGSNSGRGSVTTMSAQSLTGGTTSATTPTAAALFADPTNTYWGLQSDGFEREGTQLSAEWYAITNRQVIPTAMLTGRTYTTTKDYYWPGVLGAVRTDSWPLNEGGTEQYVTPIYTKEAYRGPCKASVTEVWSSTAPSISDPAIMMPMPLDLASPFFSINVGPTLHGGNTITLSSGTSHPKYAYAGTSLTVVATTPTTWPSSIADPPEVTPYRGGYLKRTVTIYPPSYA